ncbi:MAG: hypothetical protein M3Q08_14790, partial [Pseudomonadota bacterium]|nr:hypothetical protein [Pseudomonadota bacterium]
MHSNVAAARGLKPVVARNPVGSSGIVLKNPRPRDSMGSAVRFFFVFEDVERRHRGPADDEPDQA